MNSSARRSPLSKVWFGLALVVFGLTLYRAWTIQHLGLTLFYDEAQYWDWSRQLEWGYYSKPPLIALLIRLSTAFLGESLLGIKLSTLLLYPITAGFVGLLAQHLNPRAGPSATLLFLSLPLVSGLSLFATTDAPLLLAWSIAAWALWQAQTTNQLRWWMILGCACGIGLLAKYSMAAFALTALIALWKVPGPQQGLKRWGPWLSVALAALCLAPNLWWNAQHHFPTLQHTADITARAERNGGWLAVLEFLGGQIILIGPLGAWWALKGFRQIERPLASIASVHMGSRVYIWALSLPLLLLASIQAWNAHAHVNWAVPAHIGSVLAMTLALYDVANHLRWRSFLAIVITNLSLVAVTVHIGDLFRFWGQSIPAKLDIFVRMRGWDEAFAQVRNQLRDRQQLDYQLANQQIQVLAEDRLLLAQVTYQWRDWRIQPIAWNKKAHIGDHYQLTTHMPSVAGPTPLAGKWLFLTRDTREPIHITKHFMHSQRVGVAQIEVAPKRVVTLQAYLLTGFKGYNDDPS